jgi:transcriptional regulator with XRE-family HTH domain
MTTPARSLWSDEGGWEAVAALNVRELGDFIRDQRSAAHISLRQLAKQAGVSNPYLSQIERGLRRPSAEILQQIAKALRISAEVLYVQAGILEEREGSEDVHAAVLADDVLTARQKQVILDIYDAFRREDAAVDTDGESVLAAPPEAVTVPPTTPEPPARPAPAATTTRTRRAAAAPDSAGTTTTATPRAASTRRPKVSAPSVDPATTTTTPTRRAAARRTTTRRAASSTLPEPNTTETPEPPAAP